MRVSGLNLGGVLGAAVAIYLIGFLIYGVLLPPETWMAWSGETEAELVAANRMAFSPIMPIMTALFLAILFKLGNVASAATGAKWAAVVALASALPAMLYGWVYGTGPIQEWIVDAAHLFLGHVTAGAILGRWR